eukprot:CAMPEP_0119413466 /NCGR_PEP_ID=MMETSP1335-20130426/5547_1 /TAXON_ID=259385 /ORGANISM="Chrysoculter rhomboideus, Strain RCC1486" /LENGTH=174 /DNA_ID=CAMNT_0007438263 /DNA_START=17 /DNA_END=541 /DNA_ORIENTATION=-
MADGDKDCPDAACASRKGAYQAMMAAVGGGGGGGSGVAPANAPRCPPDREELGRHSWTLLHTIAAYYPDTPSETDKSWALSLVRALPHLYPCKECAHDMGKALEAEPPRVSSRRDFSLWMCEFHNRVNEQIGKPTFKCDLKTLDEAWRVGTPECRAALENSGGGVMPAESLGHD